MSACTGVTFLISATARLSSDSFSTRAWGGTRSHRVPDARASSVAQTVSQRLVPQFLLDVANTDLHLLTLAQSKRRTAIKLPPGQDRTSTSTWALTCWIVPTNRVTPASMSFLTTICILSSARAYSSTCAGCATLPQKSCGRVAGLIELSGWRFPCNGVVGCRTHKELTPPGVGIGADDPAKDA